MAYCSRCGTEVEQSRITCPLCNTPIHRYEESDQLSKAWPTQQTLPKRKILFLQAALIIPAIFLLTIAFLILLLLDLRPDGNLSWSEYSLSAVGSVAIGFSGILLVGRNRFLSLAWIAASILLMLKLFHFIGGGAWFTITAVPLVALIFSVVLGSLTSWMFFKKKFRMQVTIHSILAMVLCFGIDWVTGIAFHRITWSYVAAIPLGTITLTGIFSLFVLPKIIDFDKYFHS